MPTGAERTVGLVLVVLDSFAAAIVTCITADHIATAEPTVAGIVAVGLDSLAAAPAASDFVAFLNYSYY